MKTFLTYDQKAILNYMDDLNLGAIMFEGAYRFPEAFRRDADLAARACTAIDQWEPYDGRIVPFGVLCK